MPYTPRTPTAAQTALLRLDITGKTGGGATALDGVHTALLNLAKSTILYLCKTGASGGLQGWQLMAGTDAEDVGSNVIRPDDYAAATNEKVWKQVL